MHLLAREEVGLRCLLQVAKRGRGEIPLRIGAIADAEGLSPEYAAKLLRRLRLGDLVTSSRGATGGYRLARAPAEITVWDAIRVLDEDFLPESSCGCQPDQRRDCLRTTDCAVRSLWRGVGHQVRQALEGISLEDLCRQDDDRAPGPFTTLAVVENKNKRERRSAWAS